ncbi:MAG: hypothetical protein QXF28_07525 [Nitrososphaerota archaeon]
MISEREANIFEEIEEEVMKIVKMAEEVGEKASAKTSNIFKVRFLRLLGDHSKILESIGRGELVIASLEGLEDGVLKNAVKEVKEEVLDEGGSLYFISKPIILVLPKNGVFVDESKS